MFSSVRYLSSHRIFVLLLGLVLALGMSLSALQATEAATQMATMAGDLGTSGPGSCEGCGDGDDGKSMASCAPVINCGGMAAVISVESGMMTIHADEAFISVSSVARDLTAPPDPYPPRSLNLG